MSPEVQFLWLPRAGANSLDYDSICIHDRIPALPFRLALADPDPQTIRPDIWADLLARSFVDEGTLAFATVDTELMLRQAAYAACVAGEDGVEVTEPARTGFAGLTVEPGNRWSLTCSPGYCVVQLHGAGQPVALPQPGVLATRAMVSSVHSQTSVFSRLTGNWEAGDTLLLCNPTAAPWIGRQTDLGAVVEIANASLAGFQGMAKRTRLNGMLEAGDVAVAVVNL